MIHHLHKILYIIFFITCLVQGKESAKVEQQKQDLESLRQEITKYETELLKSKKNEAKTLDLINDLDKEIDITRSYLNKLEKDLQTRQSKISNHQKEISQISQELESLKKIISKRLTSYYKHTRLHDYQLLFNDGSLKKFKVWLKYQKLATENDRRNYESLKNKHQLLTQHRNRLHSETLKKEQNLIATKRENNNLQASRTKRQNNLKKIKKNTKLLEQHLEQVRETQNKIREFIVQNEQDRLTKPSRLPDKKTDDTIVRRDHTFAQLKGRLEWPTKGQIVTRFGRQKHPVLNTITENLGIEIKAPLGSPVVSVDDGQVQTITWQRGRGNIIIISHDNGYYTVYTHLSEINVELSQYVQRNQIIGTVGDSGSLEGPILNFQIWKNTKNLNPEDWIT